MNFLAHAVLAGSSAERVAGGVAGDFVKGVLYEQDYPAGVLLGLRLHRRIDAFSNREPDLRQSAQRLPRNLRRLAPPCIDILADHFLAQAAEADPETYLVAIEGLADEPLTLLGYEDSVHRALEPHLHRLSPHATRFFKHARNTRLFSGYRSFDRSARGIGYVCERLGHPDKGAELTDALLTNLSALREDFDHYWPALVEESRRFLNA